MVGPALGGLMADHWGIRAAFFGSSALAVVAGFNMLVMYHEPQVYTQQQRTRRSAGVNLSVRDILRTPRFVPILFVLFVGTFTNRSYQALIPLFVASTVAPQGTVASVTGVIVAGGALAATVSANMASRLVVYFTHAQVLFVALIACAGGSGLLIGSHTALQFGLLRVAVGLFDGSILTLSYGLGGAVIPVESRASAFGVLNSGALIGSAVSPMLGGVLAAFSLRVAFLCNAVLFGCGACVAWRWLGARREGRLPAAPTGADG
jgi:DHA1 family multidrug resistance protein-like MFS transporter